MSELFGRRVARSRRSGALLSIAALLCAPIASASAAAAAAAVPDARSGSAQATGASPSRITLAFAGDTHFEKYVAGLLTRPNSLAGVAPTLRAADFTVVNLETAVTTRGAKVGKEYNFRAPASALGLLKRVGVDAATMANNHAVDYGPLGLQDTLAAKRSGVLPLVGIGADAAQAYAPLVADVRGTRVAFLAASQLGDVTARRFGATDSRAGIATATNPTRLRAAVRSAAARYHVVVVFVHWGVEAATCANSRQQLLAKQLVADGADVIVGSHAHRPQGSGRLGRAYVGYGLGNFIWYQRAEPASRTGVLTVTIDADRARAKGTDRRGVVLGGTWKPMLINNLGEPTPQNAATTARLAKVWAASSRCSGLA